MAWMQKQSHRWDHSTRLICRYHRLSTRFELIAESVVSDISIPMSTEITLLMEQKPSIVNQADSTVSPVIVGAWSQLVLCKHLYYLPQKIDFEISNQAYRVHIWPLFLWRTHIICLATGRVVVSECLDVRRRRSLIRWLYASFIGLLRVLS
ncbi:hypothetical protein RJP56_15280 [Shewanella baltica]|uniref:hypothetical protein n=1 Tax=Shewanella baltica TaxID=62322 RepID=UPI00287122F5|nr:hypothetical protein [Shewanella baltica]MDR9767423.1 hypothetical protein [Shewanella baltica]